MKKIVLLFIATGFVAIAAITNPSTANGKLDTNKEMVEVIPEKYKACIEACNACVVSCGRCESACLKLNDPKMDRCIQLCKETSTACAAASKLMTLNSEDAKAICNVAATIADKCAVECDKFTVQECIDCAKDCREAAKQCRTMVM